MRGNLSGWTSMGFSIALFLSMPLVGGASKPIFTSQTFYTGERQVRSIYVYSFMDLREKEIGPKLMLHFRQQLTTQLKEIGIESRQLWFNDSPIRADFSIVKTPAGTTQEGGSLVTRNVIKAVPIAQMVEANRSSESEFAPTHRMLIFPEDVFSGNARTGYQLRWDIVDARTGKLEWTTRSSTSNFNWWTSDEAPAQRARVLAEGIITQMRGNGVLFEGTGATSQPSIPQTTIKPSAGSTSAPGTAIPSPTASGLLQPLPAQTSRVSPDAWTMDPEQSLPIKPFSKLPQGAKGAASLPSSIEAKNNPQGRPEARINVLSASFDFVQVPTGRFMMGSSLAPNESPIHAVEIRKPFWMGKFPVTQRQWVAVMKYNPSAHKDAGEDAPVESVSVNACQVFIDRLNKEQNEWRFRLPSEAEWEYACRAGSVGDAYGGLDAIAWYKANSGGSTHPIGQKQPNAFGLYDMLGNVWQWCEDLQHDNYNQAPVNESPWVTDSYYHYWGTRWPQGSNSYFQAVNVVRGGGWNDETSNVRSARRKMVLNSTQFDNLGFRLVSEPR